MHAYSGSKVGGSGGGICATVTAVPGGPWDELEGNIETEVALVEGRWWVQEVKGLDVAEEEPVLGGLAELDEECRRESNANASPPLAYIPYGAEKAKVLLVGDRWDGGTSPELPRRCASA